MITINLLPPEFQSKRLKLQLPSNFVLVVSGGIIATIIFLNFLLWSVLIFKNMQYRRYSATFAALKPEKQIAEALKADIQRLTANKSLIERFTSERLIWSRKLSKISEYLPRGMWLSNLKFAEGNFYIKGNVISAKGQEVTLIRNFLNRLKADTSFIRGLSDLELDSVTSRQIKGFEVSEFIITGKVK